MKWNKIVILVFLLLPSLSLSGQELHRFTLDECKDIALQNSHELRKAALDCKAAKALEAEVASRFFPNASVSGFAFHAFNSLVSVTAVDLIGNNDVGNVIQGIWQTIADEQGGTASLDFLKYGQSYGVTAIQPVFAGGRIVNGFLYSKLGTEAAALKAELSEQQVLEEVERNYFGLIALMEKEKYLNAMQNLLDSLEKVADVAFREGVIVKADYLLLQNRKMELGNGRARLKSGLRLMKMNLLGNIGYHYKVMDLDDYAFVSPGMDGIPAPEEVYVDENEAVAGLTETRLLDLQVKAAQFEKKIALGSTLPQIGLGVRYGFNRFFDTRPGRWNGLVFAAFSIPLTDWAANSYKMKRRQYDIEKAQYDREHLSEMLLLRQRKFYLELTSAWDALTLARSQREYGRYLYDQARVSYESGCSTTTDLLQAYGNLAEQVERETVALGDYLTALQVYRSHLPKNND